MRVSTGRFNLSNLFFRYNFRAEVPDNPNKRVVGRNLLQVQALKSDGSTLFTLYNTHLKSHFVPFGQDPGAGAAATNAQRKRQAKASERIISSQERRGGIFILLGDMSDPGTSPDMAPMLVVDGDPRHKSWWQRVRTRPCVGRDQNLGTNLAYVPLNGPAGFFRLACVAQCAQAPLARRYGRAWPARLRSDRCE